uniref:Uncharacterized protein n=1 Tax=Clytia hemisphaerica TaxID=252671 RepID=A0A7M5XH53_9CNID
SFRTEEESYSEDEPEDTDELFIDKSSSKRKSREPKTKEDKLVEYFHVKDAVVSIPNNKWQYKCPYQDCKSIVGDLRTHLATVKHCDFALWSKKEASREESTRTVMFKWLSLSSHSGQSKPRVCKIHGICVNKMSKHIKDQHKDIKGNDEVKRFVEKNTDHSYVTFITADLGPTIDEYDSAGDLFNDSDKELSLQTISKPTMLASKLPKGTNKAILEDFRFTYHNTEDLFKDFTRYLITQGKTPEDAAQKRNRVIYIWNCVDPTMRLEPNKLKLRHEIEDRYFLNLLKEIKNNPTDTPESRTREHNQATTIGSRLLALDAFLDFLEVRDY